MMLAVFAVYAAIARDDSVAATVLEEEKSEKQEGKSGPLPLVVDLKAPLLLEEPKPELKPDQGETRVADNGACLVCHTNYEQERLAAKHASKEVGCIKCHGKCYDHRNDEDNITPPDVMYPQDAIDPACGKCHRKHEAPAQKVIARWQQRCPEKQDVDKIVCTDCHGQHRLKLRSVRWNKKTGELIVEASEKKVE